MPMRERFRENFHLKFEIGDQIKKSGAKSREVINRRACSLSTYLCTKQACSSIRDFRVGDSEFTNNFIKTLASLSI